MFQDDRLEILRCLTEGEGVTLTLSPEASGRLPELAARTDGFTGADLRALCSNARLAALKQDMSETGVTLCLLPTQYFRLSSLATPDSAKSPKIFFFLFSSSSINTASRR